MANNGNLPSNDPRSLQNLNYLRMQGMGAIAGNAQGMGGQALPQAMMGMQQMTGGGFPQNAQGGGLAAGQMGMPPQLNPGMGGTSASGIPPMVAAMGMGQNPPNALQQPHMGGQMQGMVGMGQLGAMGMGGMGNNLGIPNMGLSMQGMGGMANQGQGLVPQNLGGQSVATGVGQQYLAGQTNPQFQAGNMMQRMQQAPRGLSMQNTGPPPEVDNKQGIPQTQHLAPQGPGGGSNIQSALMAGMSFPIMGLGGGLPQNFSNIPQPHNREEHSAYSTHDQGVQMHMSQLNNLAGMLAHRGDFESSLKYYEKMTQMDPHNGAIWTAMVYIYIYILIYIYNSL